ncbi:unnamed protein product [Anisakis simplex]|uniref:Alpha-mann_mid domain-containing protein n=1 Tax=Anisakis simplex TaxID=6269 RepID=A0A0M3JNF7_ANISI|nr:unnamed protein product [Anisakis simplex]
MQVQFGTVTDFFDSLQGTESFPLLDGDFFPYVDNLNTLSGSWTGFYNHRPYHKRFERIVQAKLRAVDLLCVAVGTCAEISERNEISRRDLALFQHHDAITGTSQRPVMLDYLKRFQFTTFALLGSSVSQSIMVNSKGI